MKEQDIKAAPVINTPLAGDTSFPEIHSLSNGIPVYLIGNGTVDLLRVEFVFNAGQRMEKVHLAASSANAMLTEGTLIHDAVSLNELIDSTGAIFNHLADKDSASLVTVTLSRKLEEVMALAAEVLFQPSFPVKEFRMMQEKRLQAFLTGRRNTSIRAREEFYRALCGETTPYGRVTRADDYMSLTSEEVNEFHSKHYTPGNMYITVAGRNPEQTLPILERYFAPVDAMPWHEPEDPAMTFTTASPGYIYCEVKESIQSTVRLGWKGITRNHPDYQGLQVATMILGGYFGSRLMRNIREEKGYTYGIHAVAGGFKSIGYITIMTDVANAYREATVNEIKKEIFRLREEDVDAREMTLVRNHIMGELARMFDGPFAIAESIRGVIDYEAGHDYYTRLTKTVNSITPKKIKELFNTYFNPEDAFEIIAGAQ
jgi:zinc protease